MVSTWRFVSKKGHKNMWKNTEGNRYVNALRHAKRDIQKRMRVNPDLFWDFRRIFVAGNIRQRMKRRAERLSVCGAPHERENE